MRKIVLTAAVACLHTAVFPQPFGEAAPAYQIVELRYENSSGEKAITRFRYDHRQRLFKALWSLEDNSRYSLNQYEHDAAGNLVSAFRDFSDGLTSFERFEYDSSGNKTAEFFCRSDSVTGSAFYAYREGRMVQATYSGYKGWLSGTLDLQYNGTGRKKKGVLLNGDRVACNVSFDYDSAGNLVREFWNFNDRWSQTFSYVYSKLDQSRQYYSNPCLSGICNYRINLEEYTYNNEVGGPSLYEYNEQGLLAKKEFVRDDGLTTHTFYEHDREGRLESSTRLYPDSTKAVFSYRYDENDNLIGRDCFRSDTLYGFESYLYNTDGELVKGYLKRFDGWLTGTVDFRSDALGKVTGGTFSGEDGFNANIDFRYNDHNLVSEITWTFPQGKFQRYRFEYEPWDLP